MGVMPSRSAISVMAPLDAWLSIASCSAGVSESASYTPTRPFVPWFMHFGHPRPRRN